MYEVGEKQEGRKEEERKMWGEEAEKERGEVRGATHVDSDQHE
jgi:hypothetical protein